MGCFDSTCAISAIPVHHGERVVRLFASSSLSPYKMANMKFGGNWTPFCLPIRGEYNDYGDIENIDEGDKGQRFLENVLMPIFKDVTPPSFREQSGGLERFKDEVHCGHQCLPDHWARGKCEWKEEERSYSDKKAMTMTKHNGSIVTGMFIHEELFDHICSLGPVTDAQKEIDDFLAARKEIISGDGYKEDRLYKVFADKGMSDEKAKKEIMLIRSFDADPMETNQLSKLITQKSWTSYGTPLEYNVSKIILGAVDKHLNGEEGIPENRLRDVLTGCCELINWFLGTAMINREACPPVHRNGQYQEDDEAIAQHEFLIKAAELQRQKLVKTFHGEPLGAYMEKDSPRRTKLLELCPELDDSGYDEDED